MRYMKVIVALVLVALGFGGWYFLVRRDQLVFGFNEAPAPPGIGVIAYGYAITFVGVVLGAIYRELQARRAHGEQRIATIPGLFGDVFRSIDFWMSACASPIVYALLWKSFAGGGIAALTIVGLQNGFCCTVILDRLTAKAAVSGVENG
jgi:hypothetical protein